MTGPAKVLVVLITVFAIALATMSSLLFAKREDFQAKLKQSEDYRKQETGQFNKSWSDMEQELAKVRAERDANRGRASEMELKNNLLADREKQLRTEVTAKTNQLDQLGGSLKAMMARDQARGAELDALQSKKQELLDEVAAKTRELQDLDQKSQALQSAKLDLENKLEKTQTELAKMTDAAGQQQQVLDNLYARFYEVRPIIDSMPMPDITGKVLYTEPGSDLVIVNVGTADQVRKNFEFTIYRGNQYIGKLRITNVEKDQAAGKVINMEKSQTIERGDSVGTQVKPI